MQHHKVSAKSLALLVKTGANIWRDCATLRTPTDWSNSCVIGRYDVPSGSDLVRVWVFGILLACCLQNHCARMVKAKEGCGNTFQLDGRITTTTPLSLPRSHSLTPIFTLTPIVHGRLTQAFELRTFYHLSSSEWIVMGCRQLMILQYCY